MRVTGLLILAFLMVGCVGSAAREDSQNTAIRDLIEVNELDEVDKVRFFRQLEGYEINQHYVILTERKNKYLLEYYQRCTHDLYGRVQPDVRKDANAIRPGIDTFRGCRIKSIYAIDEALEGELKAIGRAPAKQSTQ